MSQKHKMKITKLFEHPISGNIDIQRTLSALEHYGATIDLTKKHKAKIHLRNEDFVLALSHSNDLSKDSVTLLRHFLEKVDLIPANL